MRTARLNGGGTARYPERWTMAFCPQTVEVEGCAARQLRVTVTDTRQPQRPVTLVAAVHRGHAAIDIAPALQAVFDNPRDCRCLYVHVEVADGVAALLSFHTYCVWGKADVGDYFSSFGSFATEPGAVRFTRRVRWYRHFPFTVPLFRRLATEPVAISVDGTAPQSWHSAAYNLIDIDIAATEARQQIVVEHRKDGGTLRLFDNTFDCTFRERYGSMLTERVVVDLCNETEGIYLRWVDGLGYRQHWLFAKGAVEIKATASDAAVSRVDGLSQPVSHRLEEETRCAAVSVPRPLYGLVASVVGGLYAEMYCGGAWLPVNIEGTVTDDPDKRRQDIEITVKRELITQSLI